MYKEREKERKTDGWLSNHKFWRAAKIRLSLMLGLARED